MARFDVLGIGNAIVDVVARVEDRFLSRHDMRKGGMALIDAAVSTSPARIAELLVASTTPARRPASALPTTVSVP